MKTTTITDQPEILRLLVEQGVVGHLKPLDPSAPGTMGAFPDIADPRKWFIIDKVEDIYTAVILEDCDSAEEVGVAIAEYVRKNLIGPGMPRFHDLPAPVPSKN